jgi:signal transduction histidine kinase
MKSTASSTAANAAHTSNARRETPIEQSFDTRFGEVLRHWWSLEAERPGSAWMYVLATFIYNSAFAVILTIGFVTFDAGAQWFQTFWQTLLVSNCIGFSIHGLMGGFFGWLMSRGFASRPRWQRVAVAMALALVGIFIGYTIAFAMLGRNFAVLLTTYPRFAFGMLLIGLLGCVLWILIVDGQTRRIRAQAEAARYNEERQRLAAQANASELRALQAQIEPHFLFNTLANVLALIDYEPAKAKSMLDAFIQHLRMSLDTSRKSRATLGTELELVTTYLKLLEIRMGERLRFVVDCPDELRSVSLAPLLLQPLVENAVKYGLEPKVEGGCVTIRARSDGDALSVAVIDDGIGIGNRSSAKAGSGIGIANVRERLVSLYGTGATLDIRANDSTDESGRSAAAHSNGTAATIHIHLNHAPS